MAEAIKLPKRLMPFILKIGDSYTIIVDNKPLLQSTGSMEALVHLLAVYYVFYIVWCPTIIPSLRFLMTNVMMLEDDFNSKCLTYFICSVVQSENGTFY